MTKQRQSNIELCRIVSIILIMILHSSWHDGSMWMETLKSFTIIGVNVFVLVTGYFSTTPKKISLINLLFICFFWMLAKIIFEFATYHSFDIGNLFFITKSNWFIANYIGLLFLTPMLNLFCKTVSKKTLFLGVFLLLFIEIWFDWLPPHPVAGLGTEYGYSVLSFAIMYLLARYIKLYGLPRWFKKCSPLIYVVCSITLLLFTILLSKMGRNGNTILFAYNNPVIIISSVAFLLSFEQLKIQDSVVINYLAKSVLAVLLCHTAIFTLYIKQFEYLYQNYSGVLMAIYWTLAIVIVFSVSIVVDQIRILLYKPIEKVMSRSIKNNNIFEIPIISK